jgi:hypothetical protein
MITGGERFYGGMWKCHTAMFEERIVKAIKVTNNWKAPRPEVLQSVWSELFKTAHRASAKSSAGTLSEPDRPLGLYDTVKKLPFFRNIFLPDKNRSAKCLPTIP